MTTHDITTEAHLHVATVQDRWENENERKALYRSKESNRGVYHILNCTETWHHDITWCHCLPDGYTMSSLRPHQCHHGQLTKEHNEYPNVAILPRLGKLTYSYSTSGRTCCGLWLTRLLYLLPIPTFHKQNLNTLNIIWIFIWTSSL